MNELLTSNSTLNPGSYQPGPPSHFGGGGQEIGMKDFFTILRRRKWVVLPIMVLCIGGAYLWTLYTPKTWRAESQLMLVQQQSSPSADLVNGSGGPMMESIETQVGMIQSSAMAERTLNQLKNDALVNGDPTDTDLSLDNIEEYVKVTNPLDSNLLDITADGSDPKSARLLADAVANAFQSWKTSIAKNNVTAAEQSLTIRAKKAKANMQEAERQEMLFKQNHHLANVASDEANAIAAAEQSDGLVSALGQDLTGQQARLAELESRLKAADAVVNSPNGVPDESSVLALQTQYKQLLLDRDAARLLYTKDYPGVLPNLEAKIKATKAQLDQARQATTNNAAPSLASRSNLASLVTEAHINLVLTQARLNAAVQAQQSLQQKVAGLPGIRMQYAQLERNAELADNLYLSLQSALNSIRLDRDRVSGNIQITQGAVVPYLPYKPNLKTNLLLGTVLGLFLSLCLVMLLEQLDQRVRTLDETRALIAGPIIGMLPKTSRAYMSALAGGRQLPEFEEAFSLVRVNLSYLLRHSMLREQLQHQTLLVTSATPGEGKTVAAAQLARSMAETGKSVILVDANLRRPAHHSLFPAGETPGLADVLAGELPLEEAISTTDIEGLSVLPAGESAKNPTVLLSSPRLASVMEALRFKADVVIIDAPDCSSVADALLLTTYADCIMQVIRLGSVDMDTVHNTSLALHATGKKVTVLANGLTRQQQRAFRSRFSYAALATGEVHALPAKFEKTMVMSRPNDLVFSAPHKSLENAADGSEPTDAS